MRSLFSTQQMAFLDCGILPPDSRTVARSYIVSSRLRVLMWAGVHGRLAPGTRIDAASLILTVVARSMRPGKLAIARMRRPFLITEASWRAPSKTSQFLVPGGQEGTDFTVLRQVSFVPNANEYVLKLDVTEDLQVWLMRGEPNYGWMITGDTRIAGTSAVRFATCPALDVRYSGARTSSASALAGVHDARGG